MALSIQEPMIQLDEKFRQAQEVLHRQYWADVMRFYGECGRLYPIPTEESTSVAEEALASLYHRYVLLIRDLHGQIRLEADCIVQLQRQAQKAEAQASPASL